MCICICKCTVYVNVLCIYIYNSYYVHLDTHIPVYAYRDHHHVGGRGEPDTGPYLSLYIYLSIYIYIYSYIHYPYIRVCNVYVHMQYVQDFPRHQAFSADCRTSQLLASSSMPHSKIARSTPENPNPRPQPPAATDVPGVPGLLDRPLWVVSRPLHALATDLCLANGPKRWSS